MMHTTWTMLRETVESFLHDEALSRGASIAFCAVTSLAPLLFITIAIAGLAAASGTDPRGGGFD